MRLQSLMTAPRRIFVAFTIYSFCMGSIFPRIGDVQLAMDVQKGALGLALIGAPVGTLLALTFAGPLVERIGMLRTMLWGIPLMSLGYAVAVWATTPLAFFLLLIPVGVMIGCVEIVLNLETDRVEHAAGYRIMNRAHGFWSFGFFCAGLVGAALAGLGVSAQLHLALVVPLSVLGTVIALSGFAPAPERHVHQTAKNPRFALPTWPILLLVVVTLPAMLLEGGSMDWGAIYLRDEFGAGSFVAGLAVAAAALSQALTRFVADGFIDRFSPAGVARVMLTVLLAGCLTVVLSPHWLVSLLGFGLIGMGSSVMFPLAMSAAAQRSDRPAALNVASLAQFSFMTFLLAPPLLGFVAQHWGIRTAFGIGLPLIIVSLLTAGALGRRRG